MTHPNDIKPVPITNWRADFFGEQDIADRNFNVKPGDVFFDVGASDSYWALYAASRGATVYAFEPGIPQFRLLVESLLKGGVLDNCRVFNMGLDAQDNVKTIEDWCNQHGGPGFEVSTDALVPTRFLPIDFFLPELTRLDWVKIDVEGGEWTVIRGGDAAIRKFRPSFIIENHSGIVRIGEWMAANRIVGQILEYFGALGYTITSDSCPMAAGRSFIIAKRPA